MATRRITDVLRKGDGTVLPTTTVKAVLAPADPPPGVFLTTEEGQIPTLDPVVATSDPSTGLVQFDLEMNDSMDPANMVWALLYVYSGLVVTPVLQDATFDITTPLPANDKTITAISQANPTHVTSVGHGLVTGEYIYVTGSDSTPTIDGQQLVTVIDADHFSLPVDVTVAGVAGSWYYTSVHRNLTTAPASVAPSGTFTDLTGTDGVVATGSAPRRVFSAPGLRQLRVGTQDPNPGVARLLPLSNQLPTVALTGGEITDVIRLAGLDGDGLDAGSGLGVWDAGGPPYAFGFESGLGGWAKILGNGTFTRDTAQHKYGAASGKIAMTAAGTFAVQSPAIPVQQLIVYGYEADLRPSRTAQYMLLLRFEDADGNLINSAFSTPSEGTLTGGIWTPNPLSSYWDISNTENLVRFQVVAPDKDGTPLYMAGFESALGNWTIPAVNATIARDAGFGIKGSASAKITITGAGNILAVCADGAGAGGRFPVTAGEIYSFQAAVYMNTRSNNMELQVAWYNAGGGVISTDAWASNIAPATTNFFAGGSVQAPALAVTARLALNFVATVNSWVNGDIIHFDCIQFEHSPVPTLYQGSDGASATVFQNGDTVHIDGAQLDTSWVFEQTSTSFPFVGDGQTYQAIPDGSFEAGVAQFTAYGGTTKTQDSTPYGAKFGTKSMKLVMPNNQGANCATAYVAVPNAPWTLSLYITCLPGDVGKTVRLDIYDTGGHDNLHSVTLTSTRERYIFSHALHAAASGFVGVDINNNSGGALTIWVDGIRVEPGLIAHPFSLGRTNAYPTLPAELLGDGVQGWAAGVTVIDADTTTIDDKGGFPSFATLMSFDDIDSKAYNAAINNIVVALAGGQLSCYVADNAGHTDSITDSMSALTGTGNIVPWALAWNAQQVRLWYNGVLSGVTLRSAVLPTRGMHLHLGSQGSVYPREQPMGRSMWAAFGLGQAPDFTRPEFVALTPPEERMFVAGHGLSAIIPFADGAADVPLLTTLQTGATPAWTLGGQLYDALTAPVFPGRFFGAAVTSATAGGVNYRTSTTTITTASGPVANPAYVYELMFEGRSLEFAVANKGTSLLLQADGAWVSQTPLALLNDGNTTVVKLQFGTQRPRRITIWFGTGDSRLEGLRIGATDTEPWASPEPIGPRIIVVGDDWMAGSGSTWRDMARIMADRLGWRDVFNSSLPGTGWVNQGAYGKNAQTRYAADVTHYGPDVVVWALGQQDTASSQATVQAAVTAVLNGVTASLPLVKHIVVLPFANSGSPSAALLQTRDAVRAGALAAGAAVIIDPIGGTIPYSAPASGYVNSGLSGTANPASWWSGTGNTDAPTGSGNADRLTDGSGNPSQEGHTVASGLIAGAIAAAMPF